MVAVVQTSEVAEHGEDLQPKPTEVAMTKDKCADHRADDIMTRIHQEWHHDGTTSKLQILKDLSIIVDSMTFEHEMNCAQAFPTLSREVVGDRWAQYQHHIENAIRHAPDEDQAKLHNGLSAIMVAQGSAYCVLSQDRPMVRTLVQWIDDEHVMENAGSKTHDGNNGRV